MCEEYEPGLRDFVREVEEKAYHPYGKDGWLSIPPEMWAELKEKYGVSSGQ